MGSIAFFIAVMTPRYFMSSECRRELQFFVRKATALGLKDLVLALHYADVQQLGREESNDELVNVVRSFQWEDWRELRFADRNSEPYRRGVARFAGRLIEANQRQPATLDNIDEGFAVRLLVARKLAHRLKEPVERIESSANAFASQLHDVDQGFRVLIDQAPSSIQADPSSKAEVCSFFASVRYMSSTAHTSFASVKGMIDNIEPIEKLSRDLRRTLRRLRQALTVMLEGTEVIDEWVSLINASTVDCEECEPAAEDRQ